MRYNTCRSQFSAWRRFRRWISKNDRAMGKPWENHGKNHGKHGKNHAFNWEFIPFNIFYGRTIQVSELLQFTQNIGTGWWLGIWLLFSLIYWECHHPNWRTHSFQRDRLNHQPVIIRKTKDETSWQLWPLSTRPERRNAEMLNNKTIWCILSYSACLYIYIFNIYIYTYIDIMLVITYILHYVFYVCTYIYIYICL